MSPGPSSTLKGKHKSEVVVRTLGGIVGEVGMRAAGEPELKKGDQVLLFLERDGQGRNRVLGMSQGCFRVKTDKAGQKRVTNPLSGLSLYDRTKGVVVDPSSEVKQGTRLDELEAKKRQAEQDLARYNQKIALLDEEAEQIVAGYIKQGEEAKARILKEAESAAEKLEEQAHRNIEHEFEQAKNKLRQDVLEKALARAESIVKDTITKDDQEKLVDEYLEKVVVQ